MSRQCRSIVTTKAMADVTTPVVVCKSWTAASDWKAISIRIMAITPSSDNMTKILFTLLQYLLVCLLNKN